MTKEETIAQLRKCLRHLGPYKEDEQRNNEPWTQVRPWIRFPCLLKYVLRDLLAFECQMWPWDKIRWAIRATYRDSPIVLEDRKLGFLVGFPEAMDPNHREELIKRLEGAMHIAVRYLREVAKDRVAEGAVTIENRFKQHDDRYRYFRRRARESYDSKPPPPESGESNYWKWTRSFDHIPEWEGGHNSVAMINEYFSRFEHLAILLLPSVLTFEPSGGHLRDLINANWSEKFAALFDLNSEHEAKKLYDRLYELKEALRNPLAHGGFLKDAASMWVHLESIGALPMNFFSHDSKFECIQSDDYEKICALFDEVDSFIEAHPVLGCGMVTVKGHMDAHFDKVSIDKLRKRIFASKAMGTRKPVESYVDWQVGIAEMYYNYEE